MAATYNAKTDFVVCTNEHVICTNPYNLAHEAYVTVYIQYMHEFLKENILTRV